MPRALFLAASACALLLGLVALLARVELLGVLALAAAVVAVGTAPWLPGAAPQEDSEPPPGPGDRNGRPSP